MQFFVSLFYATIFLKATILRTLLNDGLQFWGIGAFNQGEFAITTNEYGPLQQQHQTPIHLATFVITPTNFVMFAIARINFVFLQ